MHHSMCTMISQAMKKSGERGVTIRDVTPRRATTDEELEKNIHAQVRKADVDGDGLINNEEFI